MRTYYKRIQERFYWWVRENASILFHDSAKRDENLLQEDPGTFLMDSTRIQDHNTRERYNATTQDWTNTTRQNRGSTAGKHLDAVSTRRGLGGHITRVQTACKHTLLSTTTPLRHAIHPKRWICIHLPAHSPLHYHLHLVTLYKLSVHTSCSPNTS